MPNNLELANNILRIFCNVLKRADLKTEDDFLMAGGDSLKAAMICVKIRSELNIEVSIQQIIECKSVDFLVRQLDKTNNAQQNVHTELSKAAQSDRYPLSWSQKAIYLLHKLFPHSIGMAYNLPGYAIIEGHINVDKLINAIHDLVNNQEALRITFLEAEGEIYQRVNEYCDFTVPYTQLDDMNISDILTSYWHPFDLQNGPLFRFEIYKLSDRKIYLMIDMHHLISDGVSISILLKQIQQYYSEIHTKLKFSFIDYVIWQNDLSISDAVKKQRDFWVNKYKNLLPSISLPYDFSRNKIRSFVGERKDYLFDKNTCSNIQRLCEQYNTTIFNLLLSSMFILLFKYTHEDDIIIGTSSAGRNINDINEIIGLFINTLPIRESLNDTDIFEDLLKRIKNNTYSCLENEDYQFQQLVSTTISKGELGRSPIFDVMFEVQNIDFINREFNELKITDYVYQGQGARFDLLFEINFLRENGLMLTIEYRTDLFNPQTIDKMSSYYINIINAVCSNPQISINDINMLSVIEIEKMTEAFQGQVVKDIQANILEGFFDNAKKWGNKIAVIDDERKYTYSEFAEKCLMAIGSINSTMASTGKPIGLYMERSIDYVVYITSLLYLGIPFIPLNISLPKERLRMILKTCESTYIISNLNDVDMVDFTLIRPYDNAGDNNNFSSVVPFSADNTAYIMFTSGTTGNPKGIEISHQSLANFSYAMKDMVLSGVENVLAMSAITFDPSLLETVIPISYGLTITIIPEKYEFSPKAINDIIVMHKVDFVQLTPSRLKTFDNSTYDWIKYIRTMLVGGERMDKNILRIFSYNPDLNLYNVYGPTETTVWCTVKKINNNEYINEYISVGKPIYNAKVYIVDDNRNSVPIGVIGNLLIGGAGLMKGYIGNPTLTADKIFMHNNEYVYDSGDLAKFLPDGDIELLGRKDNQIKLRGHRIEIEDITMNLSQIEGVHEAGIIFKDDTIWGFCTSKEGIEEKDIKRQLKEKLPEYMIPNKIIILDKMPLTTTGKIDYKTLEPLIKPLKIGSNSLPQNHMQEQILTCWKKVFERDEIGIQDDFFDIGGNSILAIRLVFEIEQIEIMLDYEKVYKFRTIEQMEQYIRESDKPL